MDFCSSFFFLTILALLQANDAARINDGIIIDKIAERLEIIGERMDEKFQQLENDLDSKFVELKKGQYLLSGYWGVPGQVLRLHSEKKTWNEARTTCQEMGADLVKVNTPLVNQWLAKQDKELGFIWLGANDQEKEGTWLWTDGAPVTDNQYWSPTQPDDFRGAQDCAVVNFGKPGLWDDQRCNGKYAFVCQIFLK